MARGQAGDADALRELYSEIAPVLRRYCERRAGYLGIPDEASQSALLAIHRNRHVYIPGRSFKAWMFSIARTKLIDELRKVSKDLGNVSIDDAAVTLVPQQTYSSMSGKPLGGGSAYGDDAFDTIDERVLNLRKAIADLPEKYRQVITLVKLEGYSVRETSERLGIGESAVKVRTHRAFAMLVRNLESGNED
jgi:RNA polymerase sigma-70 factor (ECF subfamily)